MTLLDVKDLSTYFTTGNGIARAVDHVSFDLSPGETLAIVGESGCGKTVLATSLMRLFRHNRVYHPSGEINFKGRNLINLPPYDMEAIRGKDMAMIFQEPMAALNPVWTIRDQIAEPLVGHLHLAKPEAYKRALGLLESLGVPSPDRVMKTYPHTLSGGMRQRVAIAMALACNPDLLIADEPTTALDVTVQAQILRLIKDMQAKMGMGVIIITHDLGIVNEIADRVLVMYSGKVIETGNVKDVLFKPKHPYTEKLLAAVPNVDARTARLDAIEGQVRPATAFVEGCRFAERCPHATSICESNTPPPLYAVGNQDVACYLYDPIHPEVSRRPGTTQKAEFETKLGSNNTTILKLEHVKTWFPVHTGILRRHTADVKAVDDVSLDLKAGETVAIVGESGCGKSTLGQTILRLVDATAGRAILMTKDQEIDIISADRTSLQKVRKTAQIIFQDPFASLNPRFSVREIIEEGLQIHEPQLTSNERDLKVGDILEEVGLPRESRFRYPHEFSGGQRQRIAIARALILEPKLLILDEATSALDVSIQAQVLNLLKDIQSRSGLTFLFITHNLGVVRHIADRVAVMYLGKFVEVGLTSDVMDHPRHPYTHKLVGSVPRLRPDAKLAEPLGGEVPSSVSPPSGCAFHTRCPKYQANKGHTDMSNCVHQPPELSEDAVRPGQFRCHHPLS